MYEEEEEFGDSTGFSIQYMNQGQPGEELVPDYSRVSVNYEGRVKYPNGKLGPVFDSSYKRNKPFQFTLGENQVIKGWEYAVMDMKKG